MKKRLLWLDIAKGIAILAVVAGHVGIIPWEPYRKIIFSFHMPLFFIAAGYTAKAELSWRAIKKSAVRLLLPYVLSCALMALVNLVQGGDALTELRRLLWGSGVPAHYGPGVPVTGAESIPTVGALWFLPCMFFSKTLFSALLKWTEKRVWLRPFSVLLLCTAGYVLGQRYKLPLCLDLALFNTLYFYAGHLYRQYKEKFACVTLGAACVALWYLALKYNALELSARFYREFPYCIVTVLGSVAASYLIFFVCEELLERIPYLRAALARCGTYSLNLLLIHHFDGVLWSYAVFVPFLEKIPFSSNTRYGLCIALVQIALYAVFCTVYVYAKRYLLLRIRSKKKKEA